MEPKKQNRYELRIYFAALGLENIQKMRELRDRLAELAGCPLLDVYKAFDKVFLQLKEEDSMTAVSHVTVNRADDLYGFFHIDTYTVGMQHTSLWLDIVRGDYPMLELDVIGNASEAGAICNSLYVPNGAASVLEGTRPSA